MGADHGTKVRKEYGCDQTEPACGLFDDEMIRMHAWRLGPWSGWMAFNCI